VIFVIISKGEACVGQRYGFVPKKIIENPKK
jgi:hypothetical protein